MSDKKAAWVKVHNVYKGRPIVTSEKKAAWDAVHAAYNVVSPSKNLKPASPPPIGTMSYKGMPQKEEIPGREGEGVKEVKAKEMSGAEKMLDDIKRLVAQAVKLAKEDPDRLAAVKFWNGTISPKLDLYGAEYLPYGAASEIGDELWEEVDEAMKERRGNALKAKGDDKKLFFGFHGWLTEAEASAKGLDVSRFHQQGGGGGGGHPAKPKKGGKKENALVQDGGFRQGTEEALRADPFLQKCFGDGKDMDDFIFNLRMVVTGSKKDLNERWTKDYGRNVYDLGEFYSRRFPKNANNVKIPAKTAKLIKTISSKWELLIMGTGDYDAYGKHEDVVMTLMTT